MAWTKQIAIGAAAIAGTAFLGSVGYAQYRDGGEEPAYAIVKSDRAFELRDYEPMIVAEISHSGSRRGASGRSFQRLAAYIFGQDRPDGGEKIPMTSPVIQDRVDQDEKIAMTSPVLQKETQTDTWRMRFVMPAKYTLETLPTAPDDITITQVPSRRIAAVKFNGYGSAEDLDTMEGFLADWIGEQGLTPLGDFEYAFYDAPMVPGSKRRNEVMIEVKSEPEAKSEAKAKSGQ